MPDSSTNITVSKEGERRMLIVRRTDGTFRFVEEKLYQSDFNPGPVWGPSHRYRSGIYETAEGAEAGARAECDWFRMLAN